MMLMVYLDEDMAALFVICSLADMQVVKTVARIPGTGISPHSRGGGGDVQRCRNLSLMNSGSCRWGAADWETGANSAQHRGSARIST